MRSKLGYLLILLTAHLLIAQLHAQQTPVNKKPADLSQHSNLFNARTLDSLQKLGEIEWRNNKRSTLTTQKLKLSTADSKLVLKKQTGEFNESYRSAGRGQAKNSRTSAVCYTISGRDYLYQDSLLLWSNDPAFTADGNVIVAGEFTYANWPIFEGGGFCMKTDLEGNVIWSKLIDSIGSVNFDYIVFFKSIELNDGSIIVVGNTSNNISGNEDIVLMKLTGSGDLIWFKTYESRFWQGYNGSGDYFYVHDLVQDPSSGHIYFAGTHFGGIPAITKIDPSDGHVIWSTGYDTNNSEQGFGIVIEADYINLFFTSTSSANDCYINAAKINKNTGEKISNKTWRQTGDLYAPRIYRGFQAVKLYNGHYRVSGPTTGYFEFPTFTGTIDLFHAAIVELDENFNFVKAWGFKNRVRSNGGNTRISLFPDGTGVFTMLDVVSGYTAEARVYLFKDDQIYHQRNRKHFNEGIPYEPPYLQLADGGIFSAKMMGDSTVPVSQGSRIDYSRLHTSDTASLCMGLPDSSASLWYINFEPMTDPLSIIHQNIFSESRVKSYTTLGFSVTTAPTCQVISHCDTLIMEADRTIICPGSTMTLTIHKNKECGSNVPLIYDTNFVSQVTRINDSTFTFTFDTPGSGYIRASLMGCILHQDSIFVEVIPALANLDLGVDTVICPSNQILLSAGAGFASYLWQDGSTDSIFVVHGPGEYHVEAENSCGTVYRDTILVADYPPIPLDIGPDRFKCNNDTIRLAAPPGFISYSWLPDYQISSLTTQQVIVSPATDTMYTVAAEKSPGCFAFDTVHINVRSSPLINLGADTSVCKGDILILDAGTGFTNYQWSNNSRQQQITVDQAGNYSVIATTIDGCISTDTLNLIRIFDLPKPDLGPDSVACIGQPRILSPKETYASYMWNTSAISNTIIVNSTGEYWVEVQDQNGCTGADTTLISALERPPKPNLGIDTFICSYMSLTISSDQPFDKYLWNTGARTRSLNITQPGSYWLQATDKNNCQGADTIIVNPKQCLEGLYVPTGFTPNGDGLNDVFRPLLFGDIISMKFTVYNRWGEIVFQTTKPGQGWDGNYKGIPQDPNLFVWTCTWQLTGMEPGKKSGTFLLVR